MCIFTNPTTVNFKFTCATSYYFILVDRHRESVLSYAFKHLLTYITSCASSSEYLISLSSVRLNKFRRIEYFVRRVNAD